MQNPPKKAKYVTLVKNTHVEQLTKLQEKNQKEVDLLEDLRLFSKARSAIEKEYAQSLVKLAEQFLTKRKFPPPPTFRSEDGKEYKTVWAVWRTVLEETRRVGEMRLQAADTYQQQIAEPAKPLKANKQQVAKKVFEQVNSLQKEVALGVSELSRCHKLYSEEEQLAHDARSKARDAEAKLNRKSTGIFTSMAKLQQNVAKLSTRRDTCDAKSTAARNDYLIHLASINAHQQRFYNTELPHLIQTLDGEMYEKVQEYFTTLARSELECCGLTQECFMKILTDSCLVSREFNLDCFLRENLVLSECVQYNFEPQAEDPVQILSSQFGTGEQLTREAEKWASRVTRENHRLEESTRAIAQLQDIATNGEVKSLPGSEGGGKGAAVDPEVTMEELRARVRRAETGKIKSEAVIQLLETSGVKMGEHLERAKQQLTKQLEEEAAQNTSTDGAQANSLRDSGILESSHDQSSLSSSTTGRSGQQAPDDSTYIHYGDEDDYFAQGGAGGETGSGVLGSSPYSGGQGSLSTGYHSMNTTTASPRNIPLPCMALYDFTASNGDELSIVENEMLELVGEGDGDGWVRARNSAGQEGFVPENYMQLTGSDVVDHNEVNVDSDTPPQGTISPTRNSTASSATYGSQHTDTISSRQSHTSNYSATDYEVQQSVGHPIVPEEGDWARALYDYDATSSEELSFSEGQLIRIRRRDENGVDDGWWEGEVNGRVGVFPSLVVEELETNTSQDVGVPGLTAPKLSVIQPTPTEGMRSYAQHGRHYGYKYSSNTNSVHKHSESSV